MAAKYSERPVGVDVLIDPCREAAKGRRAADCRPYDAVHFRRWCRGALYMRPGRHLRNRGCRRRRHEGMPPYSAAEHPTGPVSWIFHHIKIKEIGRASCRERGWNGEGAGAVQCN